MQLKSRGEERLPNPRMKSDAQQRRYAPLFRAAYAHRSASWNGRTVENKHRL